MVLAAYGVIKLPLDLNHFLGRFYIFLPGRGEKKLSLSPYKQGSADFLFQPGQVLAQGRLGDKEFLRSFCHVSFLGNGENII